MVYTCEDPELPFKVEVKLTAPFYPGEEKLSGAPFFYIDINVVNTGTSPVDGEFLLVRPHQDDDIGAEAPQALAGAWSGYKFTSDYTYSEASNVLPGQTQSVFTATEALAVDDGTDFNWHYGDITDTSWVWGSPSGYPLPYPQKVYTFHPRGYSGADWSFGLGAGASDSRTLVLSAFVDEPVLKVLNDYTYRFLYSEPSGAALTSVEDVTDYALGTEKVSILEKTEFFDSILGGDYLEGFNEDYRRLAAVSFQGYLINTWWCYNSLGERWFSVWEGNCQFHSTVDVEYNTAWFYQYFWPELLGTTLEEWTGFEKSNAQGIYLSHDIGRYAHVYTQTYPHDMPVEENTNWLLMAYSYWKQQGDAAFITDQAINIRQYAEFILACDTDGDGMPDVNTANTIDQGSPSVQTARNQTYLGIKSLTALQAAMEMAQAWPVPDAGLLEACRERIVLINHTLQNRSWMGDHFRVCDDPGVSAEEAEAYSLYASNGMLWVLSSSLNAGLDQVNLEHLRTDLASADTETMRLYGNVHSSVNNENEWVSQNIWRDAIALYLGVEDWGEGQSERVTNYWNLEKLFATRENGSFWDAMDYYGDYRFNGASEAISLGMRSGEEAEKYLEEGNLDYGGVRGASASPSAIYSQSLGYYPRGISCLSLLSAVGGLRLDRVSDSLFYQGNPGYGKVPVFSCADWDNADPDVRIPVLQFDSSGSLTGTVNDSLLPSTPRQYQELPLTELKVEPATITPDGDGDDDQARVTFTSPTGVYPDTAEILQNSTVVGEVSRSDGAYTWDGRDDLGQVMAEGVYGVRFEATATADGRFTPATEATIGVNTVISGPSRTWYLAEGYTGQNEYVGDFETWVLVQNPNDSPTDLTLTLMQPGGAVTTNTFTATAESRLTISLDSILPASECSVKVESELEVVVERAMYFKQREAGHASIGVKSPATSWYLAEGYTGGSFDEWILIQNPGNSEAVTTLYLRPQEGSQVEREYLIAAHSRQTIHVDDILEDAQVSAEVEANIPVVVERAQYLNNYLAGTGTIGARSLSYQWYFAEGYTDGGFEEWVLVQNPHDIYAHVRMDFVEPDGGRTTMDYTVPPRSRHTVAAHDILPGRELSVFIASDLPVVAERAMYWGDRIEGHATIGTPAPNPGWCFAEGYTAEGFEEWILVANPGTDTCQVEFIFMFPDGTTSNFTDEVGPQTRYTLNVKEKVGEREVSIRVAASSRVVVERAMYFNSRSGGTSTIGALY